MTDPPAVAGISCPAWHRAGGRVELAHGGGGRLSRELVEQVFLPAFGNPLLDPLGDAAVLDGGPEADRIAAAIAAGGRLAFTTDGHVVRPLFFPGGSIGDLAVNGTVNDLAMAAARPLALTASLIVEEGLLIEDLEKVVAAMAAAARAAGVAIVAGDTKVIERGRGDGLFIACSGIGIVPPGVAVGRTPPAPGDSVILSGTIGDHGMAVMSLRESLSFESAIASDTAPLHGLVAAMTAACHDIRFLRDPTRGGVAATLAEIASAADVGIEIDERSLPVSPAVRAACELFGLDPLEVANEGKLVAVVPADAAEAVLAAMRSIDVGREAVAIGGVVAGHPGVVAVRTPFGGLRVLPMPLGEQLPRIC